MPDVENPKRPQPMTWIRSAFVVIGLALVTLGVLTFSAQHYHWVNFWENAGQPFATVIAGMAALAAGALALYNGERQRTEEAKRWEQDRATEQGARQREAEQWKEERDQVKAEADRRHHVESIRELRTRFTTVTTQLADDSPTDPTCWRLRHGGGDYQ